MERKKIFFAILILSGLLIYLGGLRFVNAQPLPDLTISDVFLNEKCQVVVQVKNLGPGSVPDEVWTVHSPESAGVYIQRNGRAWGGDAIWGFDPGKSLQPPGGTVTYTSRLTISGTVTVTVTVDRTNQVKEANERNNGRKIELTCKANMPDLVVRMKAPDTAYAAEVIKIDLTVTNIGTAKAGNSYADAIISPAPPSREVRQRGRIPPLDPGGSFTVSFTFGIPQGNYELCAIADPTNVVNESNEKNNKSCQKLVVIAR
jgi:subtilase family serine protease